MVEATTPARDEGLGDPPDQSPLYHARERQRYTRQALIRQIQNETGSTLICYVAGPAASINGSDIPPVVDLLQGVRKGTGIDLLLHTGGGDIDQAERLVKLIRTRTGTTGRFRVIVPNSAKSAGTLIAVASDEIVMGEQSELGPIDPQIGMHNAAGVRIYRPAQSILDGLEHIAAQGDPDLPQAYFPLLQQLDPALIDFCHKALKRSEKFAFDFLSSYMLKGDEERSKEIATRLNDAQAYLSHGAVISADSAIELGLRIDFREPDERIWKALWSLYLQLELALPSPYSKIFERDRVSLIPS